MDLRVLMFFLIPAVVFALSFTEIVKRKWLFRLITFVIIIIPWLVSLNRRIPSLLETTTTFINFSSGIIFFSSLVLLLFSITPLIKNKARTALISIAVMILSLAVLVAYNGVIG